MRKDFDNDRFDFLDELEIHESTKEKPGNRDKNKTENRIKKSKPEEKGAAEKRAVRKKTTGEKVAKQEPAKRKAAVKKADQAEREPVRKKPSVKEAARKKPAQKNSAAQKRKPKKESPLVAMFKGLCESAADMSTGDRITISTGVLVLVLAIITGSVYLSANAVENQVAAFAQLGQELGELSVAGESGLLAVTDAEVAALNAEITPETEETEETEEEAEKQEDYILLNLTSVEKDLKIKFMNKNGGKLVSGIPFKAAVKGPDGKSTTYQDDDKDGIIYKTNLTPGTYQVSIVEVEGMDGYKFSTEAVSVKVKDKIEYKQIDVADEIKTESQVNAAKEDTAVQEAETAPALKDTVEWVESTKTAVGSDGSSSSEYERVDRDDVPDPASSARARSLFRVMDLEDENKETEPQDGDTDTGKKEEGDNTGGSNTGGSGTGSNTGGSSGGTGGDSGTGGSGTGGSGSGSGSSGSGSDSEKPAEEPKTPKVTGVSVSGGGSIDIGKTLTLKAEVKGENLSDSDKKVSWSSSDSSVASVDSSGVVTAKKAGTVTITATSTLSKDGDKKGTVTVTVNKAAVTISLDKSEVSLKVGETATVTATVSEGNVKWSSDNDKIAKVENGKITAVAEGETTVKVTSEADTSKSATCKVVVKKASALSVKLSAETLTVLTDADKELTVAVENANGAVTYTYSSGSDKIAKVDANGEKGKITGVKEGETTITLKVKDASGAEATASCKVTVKLNPKDDTTTKLKDKDGNQLYVKNKNDEYVEAVYADYYKDVKLYKKLANVKYKYTGWQNLDGKTYFFDKNGNPVTGDQVIQGAKYSFGSDGALIVNSSSGIMGIDVSKWNGTIDWTAVKNSGVNYAIIRCGYRGSSTGALIQDPKFKANIQGAQAAGIKVGVYFFTQAINEVEAVEEASMVLNLIKGYKLSYPVFIDVEGSGGRADGIDKNTRTAAVNAFCKTIRNGGYKAGIYANKTWFESKMNTGSLTGYKIWLAQYAAAPTYKATRYDMWQYTSKGKVSGISGNVDMNISYLGY